MKILGQDPTHPNFGRMRLLLATEAAELVGVRPGTIRTWVHRGYLRRAGIDHCGRHLYLDLDVYRAERDTRRGERRRI